MKLKLIGLVTLLMLVAGVQSAHAMNAIMPKPNRKTFYGNWPNIRDGFAAALRQDWSTLTDAELDQVKKAWDEVLGLKATSRHKEETAKLKHKLRTTVKSEKELARLNKVAPKLGEAREELAETKRLLRENRKLLTESENNVEAMKKASTGDMTTYIDINTKLQNEINRLNSAIDKQSSAIVTLQDQLAQAKKANNSVDTKRLQDQINQLKAENDALENAKKNTEDIKQDNEEKINNEDKKGREEKINQEDAYADASNADEKEEKVNQEDEYENASDADEKEEKVKEEKGDSGRKNKAFHDSAEAVRVSTNNEDFNGKDQAESLEIIKEGRINLAALEKELDASYQALDATNQQENKAYYDQVQQLIKTKQAKYNDEFNKYTKNPFYTYTSKPAPQEDKEQKEEGENTVSNKQNDPIYQRIRDTDSKDQQKLRESLTNTLTSATRLLKNTPGEFEPAQKQKAQALINGLEWRMEFLDPAHRPDSTTLEAYNAALVALKVKMGKKN